MTWLFMRNFFVIRNVVFYTILFSFFIGFGNTAVAGGECADILNDMKININKIVEMDPPSIPNRQGSIDTRKWKSEIIDILPKSIGADCFLKISDYFERAAYLESGGVRYVFNYELRYLSLQFVVVQDGSLVNVIVYGK